MNWDIALAIAICLIVEAIIVSVKDLKEKRKMAAINKVARKCLIMGQKIEIERQRMAYMDREIKEGRIHEI